MFEIAKTSTFIMVTPINNGQMYLKFYFIRSCFSMLRNIFNLIWLLFKGLNMVNPRFFVIPNIRAKYQPI